MGGASSAHGLNERFLEISYVLPLKWSNECNREELTLYLTQLSRWCGEVIVVDGSERIDFSLNEGAWATYVTHLPPDADLDFANGKVDGVTTGMRIASFEKVVIADDDVRYDHAGLRRMADLLDGYDLVRPQNHFRRPLPWHAKWDTARTLLNRATGSDFPGTLGVRRSAFHRAGGYDGDVLFENLELIRTISASGGEVVTAKDLFVPRLAPTTGRFFSQRVRQAYDDFAVPLRMALWLSLMPAMAMALAKRKGWWLLPSAGASCVAAEFGRRREGGTAAFPPSAVPFAPLWLTERAVCSWLAVVSYLTGGVRYGNRKIKRAATPVRSLKESQSRGGPS